MRGAICYYSGSGNTRLACRYIAAKVQATEFDLIDITKDKGVDLEPYAVVGFATFTDFVGPPYLFQTFVEGLPEANRKLAFVFNTYGFLSGKTLRMMEELVKARGFRVVMGHTLHMPESYPPQIVRGLGAEDAPNGGEMARFEKFIAELDGSLREAQTESMVREQKVRIGLLNSLVPRFSRTRSREDMGKKRVDAALCTECGLCERECPYGAIQLAPKPVFDESACYGCWRCYNRCPKAAVHTAKFRGVGQYPKPNKQLREKLSV